MVSCAPDRTPRLTDSVGDGVVQRVGVPALGLAGEPQGGSALPVPRQRRQLCGGGLPVRAQQHTRAPSRRFVFVLRRSACSCGFCCLSFIFQILPFFLAPSGPPLGLVGSARSSSEIITQWQPPLEEHRNGQILGYMIRYRLHGYTGSPWTVRNITNEAQRNCLVQELITWKDYVFQIAAYNNKGLGVYSEGVKIKTKEGGL